MCVCIYMCVYVYVCLVLCVPMLYVYVYHLPGVDVHAREEVCRQEHRYEIAEACLTWRCMRTANAAQGHRLRTSPPLTNRQAAAGGARSRSPASQAVPLPQTTPEAARPGVTSRATPDAARPRHEPSRRLGRRQKPLARVTSRHAAAGDAGSRSPWRHKPSRRCGRRQKLLHCGRRQKPLVRVPSRPAAADDAGSHSSSSQAVTPLRTTPEAARPGVTSRPAAAADASRYS